jgi:hypothetical protein
MWLPFEVMVIMDPTPERIANQHRCLTSGIVARFLIQRRFFVGRILDQFVRRVGRGVEVIAVPT